MTIPLRKIGKWLLLLIGFVILTILSFQYPFQSKLPLGNDSPTHILTARYPFSAPPHRTILTSFAALKTTYPLSAIIFSLSNLIPTTWSNRFMIWMALGHLLAGLLLGYLIKKIAGTVPAFIGMVFWAVSVIGVLSFVQIGFLPQLWSLIFLLLFFERLHEKSKIGIGITFIAMWFAHPGTFTVAALALAITLPQYFFSKFYFRQKIKYLQKQIILTILSTLLLVFLFIIFKRWPGYIIAEKEFDIFRTVPEILKSQIGIIVPFVPIGLMMFLRNNSQPKFFRHFLSTFGLIAVILGFNSLLGIGILESRFFPFAIISLIFFGSIGIWKCLQAAFPFSPLRYLALVAILFVAIFQGWHTATAYFADPSIDKTYQQLQDSQVKLFDWIKQNLPLNAIIAQNDSLGDGVVRWLPALSDRGMTHGGYLNRDSCTDAMKYLTKSGATHILYFKKFENVSRTYEMNPLLFKKVYDSNDAVIFELPVKQAINAEQMKINPATLCAN